MKEMLHVWLSSTVATSHERLLSSWHVTIIPDKLNYEFSLNINLNLSSHIWLFSTWNVAHVTEELNFQLI